MEHGPGAPPPADDPLAKLALELAPVLLWMTDADRRFEWFSTAWQRYTGTLARSLVGKDWADLVHPDDTARFSGVFANALEARQPFTLDYRLRRHDGSYRWVQDTGVLRVEPPAVFAGFVGSIVDIDERKGQEERLAVRAQSMRLAERRQGTFLAMLSHELRNPLAPIANAASVLRTLEDRNPILVRLRVILERQVARLGRLVEDLVDVTRSAQGQISLVSERLSVDALVRIAVASTLEQVERLGHTIELDLPKEPLFINGDPTRLGQALANIVSNAAKFTREPSVIVLSAQANGGNVEVTVRDPGQGIAPEFLPHVFELFAQQDQTLGRGPGGLGVGLTLARRIAQLHGGDVKAFSDGPTKGARFVLSLPLADAPNATQAALDVPPLSESYRVLIVDDDDDAREALRLQVAMWGNEVHVASNGEEALLIADTFKPHIVLCDIDVPGRMNGVGLLAPMRKKLTGQFTLFAAVSGQSRQADEARALGIGYDSFLVKPLQPATLARLIRSYASRAH